MKHFQPFAISPTVYSILGPSILGLSALGLSLSACNKKPETPAAEQVATDAGEASEAVAVAVGPAQSFADAAAASDNFEIAMSRLAESKAVSAKIESFAAEMIKAHTESTAKLKSAAASATPAITPDPALTPEQQKTLNELSAKSGADFDSAYARAQVEAHQMTLDAMKAYSANGDAAPLKAFAGKTIPTAQHHLDMAKGL